MRGFRFLALGLVIGAAVLVSGCKTASSGPAFEGTWTTTITVPITATETLTISGSSWTIDITDGGSNTAHETATLSQVDETAHHFIVTINTISGTGSLSSPPYGPGDYFYFLYSLSATLTTEDGGTNTATYPTSFSGSAQTWTKVP